MHGVSLQAVTRGEGDDVVLVPGWSMHAGALAPLIDELATKFRVTSIDLPGHGLNLASVWPEEIEALARELLTAAPPHATWLGWSLGGLASIAVARLAQDRVDRLVLLASTPRFTAAGDWPGAMPAAELDAFARRLDRDPARALSRFDALLFKGSANAASGVRRLHELLGGVRAHASALQGGLRMLIEADERAGLAAFGKPVGVVWGDGDPLIPVSCAHDLARLAPRMRIVGGVGAGHAPFILDAGTVADAFWTLIAE